MSLFSDLRVGTSGLQASQESLNVVAHNITNADTTGYVRQQVSYSTREYDKLSHDFKAVSQKQVGLGVYIGEVRQVRDRFIDSTYRNEAGRQGFYDVVHAAMEEIQEVFGELDGPLFENAMSDLYYAVSELAKDPASEVNQTMLVQYAQSFVEAAQTTYKDLMNYQDKMNDQIKGTVDRINDLGKEIYRLNCEIRKIEAGDVENPNDLYDARNQCLDELSKLVNISYKTDNYGNILVKVEGHDFVRGEGISEMGYQAEDDESVGTIGFYNVFWKEDATVETRDANGNIQRYVQDTVRNNPNTGKTATGAVFDWQLPISSELDTDVGTLKSIILARGNHRGNWTDLESEEAYAKVEDSAIMNVMAEFDGLVHNAVTAMNDILRDAAREVNGYDPATDTYGQTINGTFVNYGYLLDEEGKPIQLFHRTACNDTTEAEDAKDSATWFSTPNLYINQDLRQYPTHLNLRLPDGSEDIISTAAKLRDVFTEEKYKLNPLMSNETSLQKYYANFVAQVANDGSIFKSLKENQDMTVESVEASRQGMIGVSTDEELAQMIRFQNAYNASSRFINVIDECIEHVIMSLGS